MRWQVFSLRWTRFHRLVIFGPTEFFRYNRSIPLGITDFTSGKTVCHLFYVSSDPAPLNESCPLQASHFYQCFMVRLKDQTHSRQIPEGERDYIFIKPFLEIYVKGGERNHIKAYHLERDLQGERILVESISQGSKMLGVQEERCPHVFLRGETCSYVLLWLFALACISSDHHSYLLALFFQLWFSIPYLLPVSHARFRGSKTSKGKKSFKFIAYLYSWGHV